MNVISLPPYPPATLPAPTTGIPCTFTLVSGPPVQIQVWRRRTLVVPTVVPPPGSAPLVSIVPGVPLSTKLAVLPQAGEVVTLDPRANATYQTFAEDLTASVGGSAPWIWWAGTLGGSVVRIAGGMQVTSTIALVFLNDGTVTWTGPTS